MTNKEKGLQKVRDLVLRFNDQLLAYKKSDYNETQTRRDFIDPFFEALGWDMDNSQGSPESYREVVHEAKVKVGNATKTPDYLFRLNGTKSLFFVEAKKPSVSIKDDIHPAFQLRRYGWSAKFDISILTDFEEFAIYDCTKVPNAQDKSNIARLKYLTFNEYEKEWDFLWDTFGKEAVANGSLDKYVSENINKKGTLTVDKAFLISLDAWRTLLAETISKENKQIDEDELNFVVQHTLDRIIFLRICEDRGIEIYGSLQDALKVGNYYKNILQEFKQADDKYNSGLFDFKKDKVSNKITINNTTVKTIIDELYYPASPYEFSVLSVEILGSAYEQFLGKTITINDKGKAIVELKPEVRKAGGVYYTPQYIVDYIVANTIGNLTKNKTPKEVEEIKIVDPACGSGSFLLGAYQYLLTWHKDYYLKNPKKNTITPDGNLTTGEKKKILLNNIYGVDIDFNAVEVTKLSLLLKCMESETYASIETQKTMFKERVLPTLDANIKAGNSLIDTDYYDNQIEFGEERKIKPFSWQKNFPTVFKNGGFDVVIGNPPYVKVSTKNILDYFVAKYKYQDYQQDLYLLFLEKTHSLLVEGGTFGFIIPNTWLQSIKFRNIRKYLVGRYCWQNILHNADKVFDAVVDTNVLIFQKNSSIKNNATQIDISEKKIISFYQNINQKELPNDGDIFNIIAKKNEKELFEKIKSNSQFIRDICFSNVGVKPFQVGKGKPKQTREIVDEKPFVKENQAKPKGENWFPLMRGSLMNRYTNLWNNNSWIQYGEWLAEPRSLKVFEATEKIIVRQTGDSIIATIINENIICRNNLHILIANELSHLFILGIMNSNLTNFYYTQINPEKGEALAEVKKNHVEQLPIPKVYSAQSHNQIIIHVEQLLQLNQELQTVSLDSRKEQIKSKISYNEDKINALVYALYDLTEEEIALIEN